MINRLINCMLAIIIVGSIIGIIIGGIIIDESIHLNTYTTKNCSGCFNQTIDHTIGYYKCSCQSQIIEEMKQTNMSNNIIKLNNPPYNYLLVQTKQENCESWLLHLNTLNGSIFECNVLNNDGYTNRQTVDGFIIMLVVGVFGIISGLFFCVIFNYSKIMKYYKAKTNTNTNNGNMYQNIQLHTIEYHQNE